MSFTYQEFCERFGFWGFQFIASKNLKTVKGEDPGLAGRIEYILRRQDMRPADYFPTHYPEFYKVYKILNKKDSSDSFLPF